MSPLHRDLDELGQRLNRWEAELRVAFTGACWLVALLFLGMSDLLLRFERAGRVASWGILVALAGAGAFLIWRALARRHTAQSVAAHVERFFPELDNHLINYIQFDAHPARDILQNAYLEQGVPGWKGLDILRMKDRRAHRRAWAALGLSLLIALAPAFWSSRAWANAVLRVVNPFSARGPTTLATILKVVPGDATVLQGASVVLGCQVEGRRSQPVWLDLWPSDDRKNTMKLGQLAGRQAEDFSFQVPQAAGDAKYRFRAGDAISAVYKLRVRPPPAFQEITVDVTPMDYTQLKPLRFNALTETPVVPEGALVKLTVACSFPLASAACSNDLDGVALKADGGGRTWTCETRLFAAKDLRLTATDVDGYKAEADVRINFVADRPSTIQIIAPSGPAALGPGGVPQIQWQTLDDYGVAKVELQRVVVTPAGATNVQTVQEWDGESRRELPLKWTGEREAIDAKGQTAFRLVALDTFPGSSPRRTESPLIVFTTAAATRAYEDEKKAAGDTMATLEQLVELQTKNIDLTTQLDATLATTKDEQWQEATANQGTVRTLAARLLSDPLRPLGPLTPIVQNLYHREMVDAVEALRHTPQAAGEEKSKLSKQSLALEERILRSLKRVEQNADRVKEHREITGLLAMLDALVAGQEQTLDSTKAVIRTSAAVDARLVGKQDGLASGVSDFVRTCRREASNLELGDAEFAKLVLKVADTCETRQVSPDMLRAAEKLEANTPPQAVPLEEQALAALKDCQDLMNKWRVENANEKLAAVQEAVDQAQQKLQKLRKLQAKVVDTIRAMKQQKDMSKKEFDEMQEELQQLKENVQEAALEVAKDLQIFPELPVGNDLVDDIFQTFEETQQVPGSENAKAGELGLQKEDWILDGLEKAQGRMDDMEMWLTAKPDATKRNTENFDQAELPKIAKLPMPSELEDIIGDLLKQQEKEKDKADDSATNQGSADLPAGWDIAEGEFVDYSAKGKSGNEAPDHKEQDGRALVGRQGMSDGETVAGSGKVNAGDDKIENRRTQDSAQSGQVQEEGHADAKATGGGKLSGFDNEFGSPGAGPRRDANMPGSEEGFQAMLRRNAEAVYAKASLMHVQTRSLEEAVGNMRHAEEAMAGGKIRQVREFQQRAVVALKKTMTELNPGAGTEAIDVARGTVPVEEQVAGVADEAPSNYRDLVAEYFKSLSEGR